MALEDLIHKKRTIADLIRFIGNTAESNDKESAKTPNYSILLGAGASVTSGVRSGQELVKDWKRQVFEEAEHDESITIDDFFQPGNAPAWYEESNSYAALFENRFDLQRHRRMFVEREVSKAKPSMGYAYLVKLIENGFFNTVFTTNFDDLLNDAFYRFSKNRPIVCAHDSSISGVTVTSTRPKIIKLHGDYLYENIKATLRETESLETNMKMKFQEFAKDFGLIVIGYSGQDRSIMDILNFLLQKEDYFKNGIFWCIRKGDDNISGELKKLLWKDRVYYVEIDGFDELFAELNYQLNKGRLPVDDTFLSRKHQECIIKDLTDNPLMNPTGACKILADDCKRLKYNFENNILNDYLNYIKKKKQSGSQKVETKSVKRKNKLKKATAEEKKGLEDLMMEGFVLNHANSVLQKLSKIDVWSLEDGQYKLELLELQADLTMNMNDESIKELFDELIRLDPDNERYYEISANRSRNHLQAIKYLEMAVTRFPNDSYIINRLVDRLLEFCTEECPASEMNNYLSRVEELLEQSLRLCPSAENEAYTYKYRYLTVRHKNERNELETKKKELLKTIKAISPYHSNTLELIQKIDPKSLNDQYLRDAIVYYKKADNSRNVEKCYKAFVDWECDNEGFEKVIKLFNEFESDYSGSDNYNCFKAHVLMDNEYLEDALQLLNEIPENQEITRKKLTILVYLGRDDEADKLYEASVFREDLKTHYFSLREKYEEEGQIYENMQKERGVLTVSDAISYAYDLLQCEDYSSVQRLLKPYYDNPILAEGAVIVNYLFAKKMMKDNVDGKLRAKILDNQFVEYSDLEKLGAYCVLLDKDKAYQCLQKVIKKEPIQKYTISKWPILAPFMHDEKFIKILKPNPKKLADNSRKD